MWLDPGDTSFIVLVLKSLMVNPTKQISCFCMLLVPMCSSGAPSLVLYYLSQYRAVLFHPSLPEQWVSNLHCTLQLLGKFLKTLMVGALYEAKWMGIFGGRGLSIGKVQGSTGDSILKPMLLTTTINMFLNYNHAIPQLKSFIGSSQF